jgi:hypothetical protein
MKLMKLLMVFLVLTINITLYAALQEGAAAKEDEIKKAFQTAKKFIYSKEWQKAAAHLKKVTADFPGNKWTDESLYWLGYSLNKVSEGSRDIEKTLEIKEQALKNLATLMQTYPSSQWFDDAEVLTVEIAEELAQRGLKQYREFIIDKVKEEKEADMKAVALMALVNMDKEKAFPAAEKIIRDSKNPELREKAVFVLSQIRDDRVVPLLVEVALKDPSEEAKKQAVFWLGQIGTPESFKVLLGLYEKARDVELKIQLIFSISQTGGEKAVRELIRIYKKESSLELKKQIIFWLGQSKSKEAQEFILKILE